MLLEPVHLHTVDEFLDFAECREERYEFIDGEIVEMTGGTLNHFRIVRNLMDMLLVYLARADFERIPNGMLIKAGRSRLVAPDVIVVAGQPLTESNSRVLLNPAVVFEVTSPTSIGYDRGAKRGFYFDAPTIQAYLVAHQEQPLVELHERGEAGWRTREFAGLEAEAPIDALDCRLPLREIYQRISFDGEDLKAPAT